MRKPMIRSREGQLWTEGADWIVTSPRAYKNNSLPVRVCDARELTSEKAMQKVLQEFYNQAKDVWGAQVANARVGWICKLCNIAGMTATVKNGKVTVRKAK